MVNRSGKIKFLACFGGRAKAFSISCLNIFASVLPLNWELSYILNLQKSIQVLNFMQWNFNVYGHSFQRILGSQCCSGWFWTLYVPLAKLPSSEITDLCPNNLTHFLLLFSSGRKFKLYVIKQVLCYWDKILQDFSFQVALGIGSRHHESQVR